MVKNMTQNTQSPDFCYFSNTENHYFFHFDNNDFKHKVNDFCDELRSHNILGAITAMETVDYLEPLKHIMYSIAPPFTVVLEHYYVDKSFRDSYYKHFSSSHFNVNRFSRRLSFFGGEVSEEEFFDNSIPAVDILTDLNDTNRESPRLVYYGSIVLNPLMTGALGRTLLDPRCLNLNKNNRLPIYMRLSEFKTHVYGRRLTVKAFPYRMQDGETTRCTEITLLNILEYYSNHYPEYRSALPGEVLAEEERHTNERVLPSRGINYATLSKLMSDFGFSPRLYERYSIDSFNSSLISPELKLKRWMYYCIESGIPVAVELGTGKIKENGHSVVCIGHGAIDTQNVRVAYKLGFRANGPRTYLNSADFYDTFVIVDDNDPVYNIRNYKQLSRYPELQLLSLAVPLHSRMCLDAPDIETPVLRILNDDKLGLEKWLKPGYIRENEAVVMRLFLASSHSFKSYRAGTLPNYEAKSYYIYTPMPRFVWVCELYKVNEYLNQNEDNGSNTIKAFAEIVIDSTTIPTAEFPTKGLLLVHYPGIVASRLPEDVYMGFEEMLEINNDAPFPGFRNNLTMISN